MQEVSDRVAISAVVLAFNEERNIRSTLRSLCGWCEEIIVVDSGSSDKTVAIAEEMGCKVIVHEYVDHSTQWQWVISEVGLKCEWLLLVDSDFIFSETLKKKMSDAVAVDCGVVGYFVKHRYVFRGRPIRFGGTKKWWLRLVKTRHARLDESELVDFRLLVDGPTGKLNGYVYEDNVNEYDIDFWIDKHQKFSTRMAIEEILRRRRRIGWTVPGKITGDQDQRLMWLKQRWYGMPLHVRPFVYFAYRFVVRLGFVDGWNGFVFHFLQAFWFRMIVDEKMAKLENDIRNERILIDDLQREFFGGRRSHVSTVGA